MASMLITCKNVEVFFIKSQQSKIKVLHLAQNKFNYDKRSIYCFGS
jgi:hypothetical protein